MESGKAKFFDSRSDKRFGFIVLLDGSEIFFHFNDGQFMREGRLVPEFTGSPILVMNGGKKGLRDPQPEDELVFERVQGKKGPKAAPWSFKSMYDISAKRIATRPGPTVYRVCKTMNRIGDQPGEPEILWQGSDIQELLRKFPLPRVGQSISADPLIPYWSDPDVIFEVRHWFDKMVVPGTWEACSTDPRRRL